MMVDCTSFHGVWIFTVYSGVLMVATSILPLINFEVFLVIYQCGLIQYIKPRVCGTFLLGFGGVWIQAGTHLTQSDGLQNSIYTARSVGVA